MLSFEYLNQLLVKMSYIGTKVHYDAKERIGGDSIKVICHQLLNITSEGRES